MINYMIYIKDLSEITINNIKELARVLSRLKINDFIYYDIDRLENQNKIKKLREIFDVEDDIPFQLAHLFFKLALKYDCDNIMEYLNYFVDNKQIKFVGTIYKKNQVGKKMSC